MIEELNRILKIESTNSPTILKVALVGVLLSLLGIADTAYLTIAHYNTKVVLACPSSGFINCAKVTTSSYSEIFHIPIALLGLLFFIGMFFLQLPILWRSPVNWLRYVRIGFSIVGLILVFYLVFVEFHRLNAICLFCTAVHILTFGIFVTTIIGTSVINKDSLTNVPKDSD